MQDDDRARFLQRIEAAEAVAGGRGQRLLERMRGRATSAMSTAEIMALTRGES